MKVISVLGLVFLTAVMFSCNQPVKDKSESKLGLKAIETLEQNVHNKDGSLNLPKAVKLLDVYKKFIENEEHKQDTILPEIIFKAGNLAMNVNRPQTAYSYFLLIGSKYPEHPRAEQAAFLKAFLLDNNMHKLDAAKEAYEDFIKRFPNSEFVDDAQASLKYLGKSPEELIQEFEKKNEGKDSH